ncbi:MAG TPA: hypothetical protein VFA91_11930 [Candidatus Polarisedimenticolia bacterium]|jgi:hypothetical protein|nr:hypothetical protein [Candidatus Polarisedimenticolia bacterium]
MARSISVAVLAAFFLACLAPVPARAASQVLGLVASNGLPTPLRCVDGTCSGHFSAFCLQEQRPAPSADSEYRLAPGSALTLIATYADGHSARLPAGDLLTIRTRIGFTSVRISLAQEKLRALGAVSVAVEVAALTSILPRPVAGDPDPLSAQEIALATGPMRRAAEQPFEKPGESADAGRLSSLIVNLLPEDEPQSTAGREALWNRAVALARTSGSLSPTGIEDAHRIYSGCALSIASLTSFNLRTCMEIHHADLMAETNRGFWNSVGGS